MLPIGGRPILEYNVRLLKAHGIRDLIINLHHCPEVIVAHFGDGSGLGVSIRYSWEDILRGTAGALLPVQEHLRDTFVLLYGDNLSTCDLSRLLEQHQKRKALATVAVFHREDVSASGVVGLDGDDRITSFVEKPKRGEEVSQWVNAGIIVFEPEVISWISPDGAQDFGRDVLPRLVADGERIFAYRMSEGLWWIDSPSDYERTIRDVSAEHIPFLL
jgi:mannose-1-phosphate guanylyltransferase